MAFTVRDFHDLVELLEQHPEWRAELRRLVLSEELLALPQVVGELAAVQRRTAERLEQLVRRMDELVQRMDQLALRVEQLAEAQLRMGSDLERLKGSDLERRYRERGHAYFSRLVRRAHVLSGDELLALLDTAVTQGQLSEDEADEVLQADVVVRGRRREDSTRYTWRWRSRGGGEQGSTRPMVERRLLGAEAEQGPNDGEEDGEHDPHEPAELGGDLLIEGVDTATEMLIEGVDAATETLIEGVDTTVCGVDTTVCSLNPLGQLLPKAINFLIEMHQTLAQVTTEA
jgi:hypothetical protein